MEKPTYIETSPAESEAAKYPKSKKKIALVGFICITAIIGGVLWWLQARASSVHVPKTVTEQALFDIYVPSALPQGYTVAEDTFSLNEGVLVFSVKGPGDRAIAFTEQAVPAGFDFTSFYSKQMTEVKKIDDGPFQAVLGRAAIADSRSAPNDKMLSIRADNTWVIATGAASEADMTFIAKHLRRY